MFLAALVDLGMSFEAIRDVVAGTGHFLDQPQTLELMQTEYLYPEVGDRRTAGDWEEAGSPTVYELAHEKVKEILSSYYPSYIDPTADAAIRDEFPIKLAPEDMQPGNGRWDD